MVRMFVAAAAIAAAVPASAQKPEPIDPLTAKVDASAAHRFAKLWRETDGNPTEAQLQEHYLAGGGRAIEVFTPGRINSAKNLAFMVAKRPELYRNAVEKCLPWVEATNAQLRSTYLGLKGLFPDRDLPQIAVVVGADNSGGTAASGIQVIGLEVICRIAPTRAAFEERMRQFFAHETVHTLQTNIGAAALDAPLIAFALGEGVPDYVTMLITARVPSPERNAWALEREKWIWEQFQSDAAIVKAGINDKGELTETAQAAFSRWFGNAGSPPEGWPDELGYWVGMRIAQAYVAQAADPHAALDELLAPKDAAAILEKSGYGSSF